MKAASNDPVLSVIVIRSPAPYALALTVSCDALVAGGCPMTVDFVMTSTPLTLRSQLTLSGRALATAHSVSAMSTRITERIARRSKRGARRKVTKVDFHHQRVLARCLDF